MAHVQVVTTSSSARRGVRQDSHAAAAGRVSLKLASLGYSSVRLGADASPELVTTGLVRLCTAALHYYSALGGRVSFPVPASRLADPTAVEQINYLRLAAMSYAAARHGADACVDFARAALAELSVAAIGYCQAILRSDDSDGDPPPSVVDATLCLDSAP